MKKEGWEGNTDRPTDRLPNLTDSDLTAVVINPGGGVVYRLTRVHEL